MLTRRGRILRKVKEHYLRDDLGCGTIVRVGLEPMRIEQLPEPPVSGGRSQKTFPYLVLDTNVVLKQMDLLEHEPSLATSTSSTSACNGTTRRTRTTPLYCCALRCLLTRPSYHAGPATSKSQWR